MQQCHAQVIRTGSFQLENTLDDVNIYVHI